MSFLVHSAIQLLYIFVLMVFFNSKKFKFTAQIQIIPVPQFSMYNQKEQLNLMTYSHIFQVYDKNKKSGFPSNQN